MAGPVNIKPSSGPKTLEPYQPLKEADKLKSTRFLDRPDVKEHLHRDDCPEKLLKKLQGNFRASGEYLYLSGVLVTSQKGDKERQTPIFFEGKKYYATADGADRLKKANPSFHIQAQNGKQVEVSRVASKDDNFEYPVTLKGEKLYVTKEVFHNHESGLVSFNYSDVQHKKDDVFVKLPDGNSGFVNKKAALSYFKNGQLKTYSEPQGKDAMSEYKVVVTQDGVDKAVNMKVADVKGGDYTVLIKRPEGGTGYVTQDTYRVLMNNRLLKGQSFIGYKVSLNRIADSR